MGKKAGTSKAAAASRKSLFIEAYIANGGNATNAAISAGYSAKTAYSSGARLLKDVEIFRLLSERKASALAQAEEETGLTIKGTLRELSYIVHSNPKRLYDADGNMKQVHELEDRDAAAIASLETQEQFEQVKNPKTGQVEKRHSGYVKKLKMWDKNAGIDKAMKYFGLFKEDNAQLPPVQPPVIHVYGVRAINGKPA